MNRAPETERDQIESEFSLILRAIWASDPAVLAAAFVDMEGECVDYVSSIDPFDAKVIGAQMLVIMLDAATRLREVGHGETLELVVCADQRDLLARRLDEDYLVVVATAAGGLNTAIINAVDRAAVVLVREAGMAITRASSGAHASIPPPDPSLAWVDVELRASRRWSYAPVSFDAPEGKTRVAAVLGRFQEANQVCFRIRVDDGRELNLAHDLPSGRWLLIPDSKR